MPDNTDAIIRAIVDILISHNESGYRKSANVADGLFAIADAIRSLSSSVDILADVLKEGDKEVTNNDMGKND